MRIRINTNDLGHWQVFVLRGVTAWSIGVDFETHDGARHVADTIAETVARETEQMVEVIDKEKEEYDARHR